jgi:hypothetical protein
MQHFFIFWDMVQCKYFSFFIFENDLTKYDKIKHIKYF